MMTIFAPAQRVLLGAGIASVLATGAIAQQPQPFEIKQVSQ